MADKTKDPFNPEETGNEVSYQKNNKLKEFEKNKTKQTMVKSDDLRYPNADEIYE